MRLARYEPHVDACRHPRLDMKLGDRCIRGYSEALTLALRRATELGVRQSVRQHTGWLLKGVWFVQSVRESPEVPA